MFRLIKLTLALGLMAAIAWFAMSVKLGSRTLYEHARAIGDSAESQELVRGTKQKVTEVKDEVSRKFGSGPQLAEQKAPAEDISEADRQDMKRLLDSQRR